MPAKAATRPQSDVQNTAIVLTLRNPDDGGPWLLRVRHRQSVVDARVAIAAACNEFLQTRAGRDVLDENGGSFNYGDAAVHLPPELLVKHGLLELHVESPGSDDHDRNFAVEPRSTAATQ